MSFSMPNQMFKLRHFNISFPFGDQKVLLKWTELNFTKHVRLFRIDATDTFQQGHGQQKDEIPWKVCGAKKKNLEEYL